MLTVKGVKRASGNYQGNDYDNANIHCTGVNDGSMLCGDPVEVVKIKFPLFMERINALKLNPSDLVGKKIRVFYNKYGGAEDFELIQ